MPSSGPANPFTELWQRRKQRVKLNNSQREAYNSLLVHLEKRGRPVQNEEKQFCNILKLIIEGGWIIRESEMEHILSLVEFNNEIA